MLIPGGCSGSAVSLSRRFPAQRHIEGFGEGRHAFRRNWLVHERVADLAQRGEFRAGAVRLAIDKPARWLARCAAFQAIELIWGQAGFPRVSLVLDEANQGIATDERWPLIRHGRHALLDPRPDGAVRDAGYTRRLLDRVAAERLYPAEFG